MTFLSCCKRSTTMRFLVIAHLLHQVPRYVSQKLMQLPKYPRHPSKVPTVGIPWKYASAKFIPASILLFDLSLSVSLVSMSRFIRVFWYFFFFLFLFMIHKLVLAASSQEDRPMSQGNHYIQKLAECFKGRTFLDPWREIIQSSWTGGCSQPQGCKHSDIVEGAVS